MFLFSFLDKFPYKDVIFQNIDNNIETRKINSEDLQLKIPKIMFQEF